MTRFLSAMIAAGLAALISMPATAGVLDISTETCKDFTASITSSDKEQQNAMAALLYWLEGYNGTEAQATVMDFGAMKKNFTDVIEDCSKNPAIGLMTTSEKFMGEHSSPKTSDVVDIATMTCEQALASGKQNTEGLGYIMMWLAGYHASYAHDTVYDSDKNDKAIADIGASCKENPQVGLFTTTKKFMNPE